MSSSIAKKLRGVVALVVVLSLMGLGPSPAGAEGRDSRGGYEGPTVVAEGLDQPRGLAFNRRGELFIAEAGSGGDLEEVGFYAGALHCTGLTGAVTRVDRRGNQRRIIEGLPSSGHCDGGAQAVGPAGIIARGSHSIAIQMGSTASFYPATDLTVGVDRYGMLLTSRRNGRNVRTVADVTSYEAANDIDGEGYDSNPTDVAAFGRRYVVTDAGANAVHVIRRSGEAVLSVEIPQEPCPGGPANCFGDEDLDSVPTGIVRGRGNIFYISTLSGAVADFTVDPPVVGFQPGNGKIFAFNAATGEISEFADGLTAAIDVTYDRRANVVYVAEFLSGAVWAIDARTGERTRVDTPGDLVTPGGLAVDRRGNLYVSTFTAAPGGAGQVVMYER